MASEQGYHVIVGLLREHLADPNIGDKVRVAHMHLWSGCCLYIDK